MKKIIFGLSLCISQAAYAQQMPLVAKKGQVLEDRSFEDCKGNIYSVNDLLAEGKPLIMFQSTVDCGYCFEEAPRVSEDILKYKDRINFVFTLSPHNTYPRCTGNDAGDHDWPGDWQDRYPGYREIPCCIQPSGNDYFLLLCEVTTSFGLIDPLTKKIVDGGCRDDGREAAVAAALKMYSDGKISRLATSVTKPTINFSGTGNSRTITIASSTSNANIYYTINGETPSINSPKYTSAFVINNTALVKAIAYKSGMNNSPVMAKKVEFNNTSLINIAQTGVGYEWTGLTDIKSNNNRKALAGVNDGKMVDVRLNGGQEDNVLAYEAMGVVWDNVKTGITNIKLTHHTGLSDGWGSRDFFGFDMRIQSTQDGTTWTDLTSFGHYPEYPYGGNQKVTNKPDPTYFFSDKPLSAKGIRIAGQVRITGVNWGGMTASQAGLKELEIFKDNSITSLQNESSSNGFNVYPNPAKNIINIQLFDNMAEEIEITDIAGRVAILHKVTKNLESIDVNNLSKGLYIVNLKGGRSLRKTIVIE